ATILLREIRGVVGEAAEQALSDGKIEEARELYRLLGSQFAETPTDKDSHLRRLEFFKTLHAAKEALEAKDLRDAETALDRALDLKPPDEDSRKRLEELVEGIKNLRGGIASQGPRGALPSDASLAEAVAVAAQGYRVRVPAPLNETLTGSLY